MNRTEKIVAAVLGTLVFFGLFFFIYSSMKNSPAAYDDVAFNDFADEEDLGDDFTIDPSTTTLGADAFEAPAEITRPAATPKK